MTLKGFISESNRIEGIHWVTEEEILAHESVLNAESLSVELIEDFVWAIAQRELRDRRGRDVQIKRALHRIPEGGPAIRRNLETLLDAINKDWLNPYLAHCQYELLHPFMDGNGRSGRAIWAWHMQKRGENYLALPFLQAFYYQALDASG